MSKDMGGNPGSRADASSPQAVSTEGFPPGSVTVGLLGAEVDMTKFDLIGPRYITECRLEEIERRILAIEELVWPLGR